MVIKVPVISVLLLLTVMEGIDLIASFTFFKRQLRKITFIQMIVELIMIFLKLLEVLIGSSRMEVN
jgi:hypothetical protein